MIDFEKFRKSLQHLEAQFANFQAVDPTLPELTREAIQESVVQRFETCYDALWKVLRRYLTEELGIPKVPLSPKGVFRLASVNGLLPSPVEQWFQYVEARVGTSHDYSQDNVQRCVSLMTPFLEDAKALHHAMTGTVWN